MIMTCQWWRLKLPFSSKPFISSVSQAPLFIYSSPFSLFAHYHQIPLQSTSGGPYFLSEPWWCETNKANGRVCHHERTHSLPNGLQMASGAASWAESLTLTRFVWCHPWGNRLHKTPPNKHPSHQHGARPRDSISWLIMEWSRRRTERRVHGPKPVHFRSSIYFSHVHLSAEPAGVSFIAAFVTLVTQSQEQCGFSWSYLRGFFSP